jgi:hypothetical protein
MFFPVALITLATAKAQSIWCNEYLMSQVHGRIFKGSFNADLTEKGRKTVFSVKAPYGFPSCHLIIHRVTRFFTTVKNKKKNFEVS